MATEQIPGSGGVIGPAAIPERFSHAVLRRGGIFLKPGLVPSHMHALFPSSITEHLWNVDKVSTI